MDIISFSTSWVAIITLATVTTYFDKKKNVTITDKMSYIYISSDALLRIIVLSIVTKVTLDFFYK